MLPWLLKDVAGVIVRFQLLMLPELLAETYAKLKLALSS